MDVLIDSDPAIGTLGCDPEDSLAITMALTSPEITVRAITCVQGAAERVLPEAMRPYPGELGEFVQRACAASLPSPDVADDQGPYLYDTLAVAAALRPELLTLEPALVEIETESEVSAGTSVAWLPGRPST